MFSQWNRVFFRKFEDEKFASTLKFVSINNKDQSEKIYDIRFFFNVLTLNEKILKCWK